MGVRREARELAEKYELAAASETVTTQEFAQLARMVQRLATDLGTLSVILRLSVPEGDE